MAKNDSAVDKNINLTEETTTESNKTSKNEEAKPIPDNKTIKEEPVKMTDEEKYALEVHEKMIADLAPKVNWKTLINKGQGPITVKYNGNVYTLASKQTLRINTELGLEISKNAQYILA